MFCRYFWCLEHDIAEFYGWCHWRRNKTSISFFHIYIQSLKVVYVLYKKHGLWRGFEGATWYDIIICYHDIIPWYHIMILYHDIISWCHIMISYHDVGCGCGKAAATTIASGRMKENMYRKCTLGNDILCLICIFISFFWTWLNAMSWEPQ